MYGVPKVKSTKITKWSLTIVSPFTVVLSHVPVEQWLNRNTVIPYYFDSVEVLSYFHLKYTHQRQMLTILITKFWQQYLHTIRYSLYLLLIPAVTAFGIPLNLFSTKDIAFASRQLTLLNLHITLFGLKPPYRWNRKRYNIYTSASQPGCICTPWGWLRAT